MSEGYKAPTRDELRDLLYWGFTTSTGHGERVDEIGFALAVLARWGNQAPQPIPLSERKPGLEDCDEEGRCWLFDSQIIDAWVFREFDLEDQRRYGNYTHWLPATALPLPV